MKENTTSNEECLLLLTGTIQPNTQQTVKLIDGNERRKQYIDAIDFYLQKTNFKLLFVENSGNDISDRFQGYESRIEFLTYVSQPTVPDRGKGYKEMEILNYAMNTSKFINDINYIIKITGRLKILNINYLLQHNDRLFKTAVVSNIYKLGKMDSRFFLFNKKFWPYLKDKGEKIDINYSFEQALWLATKIYCVESEKKLYRQFSSPLLVKGTSGSFDTPYYRGFLLELIKKIRHRLNYRKNMNLFYNQEH